MKTAKKQSQRERLLAYLRKHRKGITTMEAFEHLRITCVHKRIAELESELVAEKRGDFTHFVRPHRIIRTREKTASGSIVTRYKLAR
jgi:hypothetical protein